MKRIGLLCLALLSCGPPERPVPGAETSRPRPRGPYLGEEEPGEEPRLFSPGFHAGPQNGGRDIYWVKSTTIEERRRERAP